MMQGTEVSNSRYAWNSSGSTITWDDIPHLESSVSETMAPHMEVFRTIIHSAQINSTSTFDILERIGTGGESYVFRTVRSGSDGFSVVSAVKVYSPAIYPTMEEYEAAMQRVSHVAASVVRIQHDHLVDVWSFYEQERIRFMTMEWINGFDLKVLTSGISRAHLGSQESASDCRQLQEAVVAGDEGTPRFSPGIVVHIVRECLSGIAALHRLGLVHGDIKPSNIMVNRTGSAKLIDIGANESPRPPRVGRLLTPHFAAPEVLLGGRATPQSDLASLGYTLIALLLGRVTNFNAKTLDELLNEKRWLVENLHCVLPDNVCGFASLMSLCKRLIAFDEKDRVTTAEDAIWECDVVRRQLVLGSLDCDYSDYLRRWMDQSFPM